MNWLIRSDDPAAIRSVEPECTYADGEDEERKPEPGLVTVAVDAAISLQSNLGGEAWLMTIYGHETTTGAPEDFQGAHVTVTVSRTDPAA